MAEIDAEGKRQNHRTQSTLRVSLQFSPKLWAYSINLFLNLENYSFKFYFKW